MGEGSTKKQQAGGGSGLLLEDCLFNLGFGNLLVGKFLEGQGVGR
jgi:hypothetical protein